MPDKVWLEVDVPTGLDAEAFGSDIASHVQKWLEYEWVEFAQGSAVVDVSVRLVGTNRAAFTGEEPVINLRDSPDIYDDLMPWAAGFGGFAVDAIPGLNLAGFKPSRMR